MVSVSGLRASLPDFLVLRAFLPPDRGVKRPAPADEEGASTAPFPAKRTCSTHTLDTMPMGENRQTSALTLRLFPPLCDPAPVPASVPSHTLATMPMGENRQTRVAEQPRAAAGRMAAPARPLVIPPSSALRARAPIVGSTPGFLFARPRPPNALDMSRISADNERFSHSLRRPAFAPNPPFAFGGGGGVGGGGVGGLLAASRPTEVLTEAPKYRYAPALSWAPAASTPNSTVQHTGSAIVGGSPISRRLDTEFESLARAAAAALPAEQGEAVTPEETAPPSAFLNIFTKPVPEPAIVIAKPATEPTTESATKPTTEPATEHAAGLTAKPTAEPDAEGSLAILSAPLLSQLIG
ncbi:hypothetical protein T492DRAFT_913548, partial [Pavlovales sp. CCMP2436]